jgi:hypothetical protein
MRAFQKVQNRSRQTAAAIQNHVPMLAIANIPASGLLSLADGLNAWVRECEKAASETRQARYAAKTGFLAMRDLDLRLPHLAEHQLRDDVPAEAALLELLPSIYVIKPRTTNLATARAQLLVAALAKIDAYLGSLTPPRPAISVRGRGAADLSALLAAQPKLEKDLADAEAAESLARAGLRRETRAVDRLNKRFYKGLGAEARFNDALAAALGQITTEKSTRRPRAVQ